MQNLRDKLLKAGVVSQKAKKKAEHQSRLERTRRRKQGLDGGQAEQAERERFERKRADKRAADQQREIERQQDRAACGARRAERVSAREEEQDGLRRVYRARELLQASMFLPARPGPVRFCFVSRSGGIRCLELSTRIAHDLSAGLLAICQLPGERRWGLARRDVVEQVLEVEPELVRFFVRDPGSGAELAETPAAVETARRRRGLGRRFGPQAAGRDDRHER
ncbi:MAG: hypothetical protein JXR96_11860 [Deltaproteobacteria bacterium]|nr:hypothetical protein [Deltaproteobacteria bacterium]